MRPLRRLFMKLAWVPALALLGLVAACGGGSGDDDDDVGVDSGGGGGDGGGGGVDGGDVPDGWQPLMAGDWSLAAGDEGYFCVVETIERDTYVKGFRPINPLGTHHTVVTLYD